MSRRSKYTLSVWILVVLALLPLGCGKAAGPGVDSVEKRVPVEVVQAEERAFSPVIRSVGTVLANRYAYLSPEAPGKVAEVLVDLGDEVRSGDVLLRIDREQLQAQVGQAEAAVATAEAGLQRVLAGSREEDVASARAQFENAEKEYGRLTRLHESGAVPEHRLDSAKTYYTTAREALEKAVKGARSEDIAISRAELKQAKAALSMIEIHLAHATVRAPFDGCIASRTVEVGQMAAPGQPMFEVADIKTVKVSCAVPEVQFGELAPGTSARILVDAYPDDVFSGQVSRVSPTVRPETRTFAVEIEVPNAEGRLRPGMFARVELVTREERHLALPADCLHRYPGTGTDFVFCAHDGVLQQQNVVTGLREANWVAITQGLSVGQEAVITGGGHLRSGLPVEVVRQETAR